MTTMKPVPFSGLASLQPIFALIHGELNAGDNITPEEFIANLQRGYDGHYMGVYVDDFESPKHLLVLAHYPGLIVRGFLTAVVLIYSIPEARNEPQAVDAMFATIDGYAMHHRSTCILGSSWEFRGAQPIAKLWKSRGYEPQETTFVRFL